MSTPSDPSVKVVWHPQAIERVDRESLQGHRGGVVWFTGLSGSGKSTVANLVERALFARRVRSYLLDGDNVRHGLCAAPGMLEGEYGAEFAERFGLGFSPLDREENIRRVGTASALMVDAGLLVLTAFVSPYRRDRDRIRAQFEPKLEAAAGSGHCVSAGEKRFIEVFVDTPLEVCESRDPKGLYQLARQGKIQHFTGISDPYEPPLAPEIRLDGTKPVEDLVQEVVGYLIEQRWI